MINIRYRGLLMACAFLLHASAQCAAAEPAAAQSTPTPIDVAAPATPAQAASRADAERLATLIEQMMPFGPLFDQLAKNDPKWPMQDLSKPAKREHLQCIRAELSSEGYRRQRLAEARAYADENPSLLKADIEVLERGAASLYAKMIAAGMESAMTGVETDPADIIKQAKPEEVMHFMAFFTDPSYAPLRKLVGVGEALNPEKSGEENRAAGQMAGGTFARKYFFTAMSTCNVPMSEVM